METFSDILETSLVASSIEDCYKENLTAGMLSEQITSTRDKLLFLLNTGDNGGLWRIFEMMQRKIGYENRYADTPSDDIIMAFHALSYIYSTYINYVLSEGDEYFDVDGLMSKRTQGVFMDICERKIVNKGDCLTIPLSCKNGEVDYKVEIEKDLTVLEGHRILLDSGLPIFDDEGRPYYFLCWHPIFKQIPVVCAIEDDDIGMPPFQEKWDDSYFDWDKEKLGIFSVIIGGDFIPLDDFEEGNYLIST